MPQDQQSLWNTNDKLEPNGSTASQPIQPLKPAVIPSTLPVVATKKIRQPKPARTIIDDLDATYNQLIDGLKTFFDKNKFARGVLGVSGGVDSALVLKIAVDALGADNVTALIMPEIGLTRQENIDHAKMLCAYLGVEFFTQPINSFLIDFKLLQWKPNELAAMNVKARIRALLLYSYANTTQALVLGTSNKSEALMGYGTKYGDLACDVQVIGSLLKTEVVQLADHIGLPPEIVNKTPSAELSPGQTDEAELGATYQDLDKVLQYIDLGAEGCIEKGLPVALVHNVFRAYKTNKHKSDAPPILKLSLRGP